MSKTRRYGFAGISLLVFCGVLFLMLRNSQQEVPHPADPGAGALAAAKEDRATPPAQSGVAPSAVFEPTPFPFLGRIPLEHRTETLKWNDSEEHIERPFKTFYTKRGILVRAEYEPTILMTRSFHPHHFRCEKIV
jgi:hypothetical protein